MCLLGLGCVVGCTVVYYGCGSGLFWWFDCVGIMFVCFIVVDFGYCFVALGLWFECIVGLLIVLLFTMMDGWFLFFLCDLWVFRWHNEWLLCFVVW